MEKKDKIKKFGKNLDKLKTVYLDTMCFVYYFEENKIYYPLCRKVFQKLANSQLQTITSVLTATEILIYPKKADNLSLERMYKSIFLKHPYIKVVEFDFETAEIAAELGAKYNIKTPDAIHLATALNSRAQAFITNDPKLKQVKEMRTLILRDYL